MNSSTETPGNDSSSSIQDHELIEALCGGDKTALDALMQKYKVPLHHFIRRYIGDEEEAYDILQETFVRVYTRAETFNPRYKFKTWLYQIALNLCRDAARKAKLQSLFSLDAWNNDEQKLTLHDLVPSDDNVESLVAHRETLRILEKEIQKLPHKLKTALLLFVLEDYSQEECAEILGVTPKTIEMRVYRARKELLKKLASNL